MTAGVVSFVADGCPATVSPGDEQGVLANHLRDALGLTAINLACEEGSCGACTALVDGRAVPTCLVRLGRLHGAVVETAATVAVTPLGARIADAIVAGAGLQCGFCTPGIVCEAYALLRSCPGRVTATDVEDALAGHLCRCTGYRGFVMAVAALADPDGGVCDEGGGHGAR
jgi:aerobic-type carbon monoxide dehydrogenase small subunit (CoxS/CutS family)